MIPKLLFLCLKLKSPINQFIRKLFFGAHNAASAANTGIKFEQFLLDKNSNSQDINKHLETKNIVNIIVLGRIGWRLAKQLSKLTVPLHSTDGSSSTKKKYSIVSGALPISPNGLSGVSLITDPSHLFRYLDQVAPQVKNIHVAYSDNNQWLIELAQTAAKSQGLKFTPTKVQTTKEAIEFYQTLLTSSVSEEDALWLPLDKITSHDKITLPMILEKAWAKEVVVFSSKPSHAKRGVLFSTYPDNFSLGKHLFSMS